MQNGELHCIKDLKPKTSDGTKGTIPQFGKNWNSRHQWHKCGKFIAVSWLLKFLKKAKSGIFFLNQVNLYFWYLFCVFIVTSEPGRVTGLTNPAFRKLTDCLCNRTAHQPLESSTSTLAFSDNLTIFIILSLCFQQFYHTLLKLRLELYEEYKMLCPYASKWPLSISSSLPETLFFVWY